jgi:two-component system, sporulation sensor kinase B
VKIEIADTGCGMTDVEVSRLGTPFYSTKSRGTGLGLSFAFEIIRLMNGKIEVKSKRKEGTTVAILLPFASFPAADR